MHTLGHDFVPPGIHAGGLRYHGMAPLVSQLVLDGLVRAEAYGQTDVFASAVRFARSEGIIPAPEAAHAIHGVVQAAAAADEEGRERTILFNLSGHGHFDLGRLRRAPARPARGFRAPQGRDVPARPAEDFELLRRRRTRAPGHRAAAEAGGRHQQPLPRLPDHEDEDRHRGASGTLG